MYKDIIIHFCRYGKRILKRKVDVAMKDQHTKQTRSVVLSITAILLMLVISIMGFTAIVSADEERFPNEKVSVENFEADKSVTFDKGVFYKEYDGTPDATLRVSKKNTIDGYEINYKSAIFVDDAGEPTANVADATHIRIDYELVNAQNVAPHALFVSAKITPSKSLTYTAPYSPYGIKTDGEVTLTGVAGETVTAVLSGNPEVKPVGTYKDTGVVATQFKITNSKFKASNYDATAITVKVTPLVITRYDVNTKSWFYGTKNALKLYDADDNVYYAEDILVANRADDWKAGNVIENEEGYILRLNENCVWADDFVWADSSSKEQINVTIKPLEIKVDPSSDVILGDGEKVYFPVLNATCANEKLLAEAMSKLVYTIDGQAFNGASYGDYSVTVSLSSGNFLLVGGKNKDTTYGSDNPLVVDLKVRYESREFKVYDQKTNEFVGIIILKSSDENGFTDAVNVTATALKGYPKIVKNKYNLVYEIEITGGAENQTFSVIVPLNDTLVAPRTEEIKAENLFFYESATRKLVPATDVKVGDGYVEFGGLSGKNTCVISPDYNAPFFQTVWGILLIVVLVLGIVALMCYMGLRLRRELETKQAAAMVIDTVGELPETEAIEVEEKAEVDENAVLEETAEEIAESVEDAVEETVVVDEEALNAAVEEAIEEVKAEAAEEVIEVAADEAIEEVVEAVAAEVVAEAAEEVVEAAAEEVVEAAAEEVVEAAAEEVVEAAAEEVVEAAAEEEEEEIDDEIDDEDDEDDSDDEDDGDDNDEDDADGENAEAVEAVSMVEEDTTFGFGVSADLATFIDVKENPEAYQEMLAREARGEIKIVYRYKKSFQSKLAQSQGNVQDYYSELKNALLTFKGVKSRMSWNYEAFNKGRAHVAKMDAKSKTLYLYLALDPAQFAETKYSIVDVSAKRKYATTPTLMKIKGERKFKHALELIEKLCGEQLELAKVEAENVDYRVERMTIDEMVDAGLMKKSAGYVVLASDAEAVAADAQVETAPEQN